MQMPNLLEEIAQTRAKPLQIECQRRTAPASCAPSRSATPIIGGMCTSWPMSWTSF